MEPFLSGPTVSVLIFLVMLFTFLCLCACSYKKETRPSKATRSRPARGRAKRSGPTGPSRVKKSTHTYTTYRPYNSGVTHHTTVYNTIIDDNPSINIPNFNLDTDINNLFKNFGVPNLNDPPRDPENFDTNANSGWTTHTVINETQPNYSETTETFIGSNDNQDGADVDQSDDFRDDSDNDDWLENDADDTNYDSGGDNDTGGDYDTGGGCDDGGGDTGGCDDGGGDTTAD